MITLLWLFMQTKINFDINKKQVEDNKKQKIDRITLVYIIADFIALLMCVLTDTSIITFIFRR
jgi:hypothetical protein